ncbi:DUF2280 domain-containing protein [Acinetobacter sichuanensis]|uniref:DUF2280 domain-containing protein n=1 Tax=Acinetobacter sichuanensis TaxID=2136183 RepID=UPI00280FE0EB|nr:DUF2280 domain-containing protein [Acinetobacter sichuanensis]MDQ9023288.1 DUF2280 domain-containing protein [Acinetobacter sichuanensis]
MATLKEPVKIFIVQALACRDTPQEVVDLVKQEFGIEVNRMQCASYDPTKVAGKNLSKKFKDLFEETRKKFDEGLIDIPIAIKHYRMKQYDKLLNKTKNTVMALKIMEQAAKDSGGQFTNKTESSIKNETSYPSGLGHFYGRSSNTQSDT